MPQKNRVYMAGSLLDGWYWFDNALQEAIRAQGFPDLNNSQSAMLFHIAEGVTRPIEIARKMRLSRQAIRHIANQLIDEGILVSVDDPEDGRSKILKYSSKARNLRQFAHNVLMSLEDALQANLGRADFTELKRLLDRDWGDAVQPSRTVAFRPRKKNAGKKKRTAAASKKKNGSLRISAARSHA